jgi:surface antigen
MSHHRYRVNLGRIKVNRGSSVKKTMALVAAIVLSVGALYPLGANAEAPLSASISVNGQRISTLAYGSDATLSWSTSGTDECVVRPGDWSDLQGTQILNDVTSKRTYLLVCTGQVGIALAYTTFAVAPPTLAYLRDSLIGMPDAAGSDTALISGMTQQITEAESKYTAGFTEEADKLLDLTVSRLQKMLVQEKVSAADVTSYTEAVKNLKRSLEPDAPVITPNSIPNDRVIFSSSAPGTGPNCGGGYPARWCEIPQYSAIDSWGMYNRTSVSYAAFKVHMDFLAGRNSRDMPYWGGRGAANQWDDNARAAGIPVNSTPEPGAIAVSNAGAYGHVMYVERVETINGQPAIYGSQYDASFDGRYSERWLYTSGLVFIHF